mgnify:CR=1 FL=1
MSDHPGWLRHEADYIQGDDPDKADQLRAAADEGDRHAAIVAQIPPRLLRVFEALTIVEVPDGWTIHLWDGGVYGITVRRSRDGHCKTILPSTDETPRWYLGLHDEYNGHMGADAQDAVNWTVAHAPGENSGDEADD